MTVQWQVLKFGGTSVSNLKNWQTIAQIVRTKLKQNKKLFVVHSALSNVSNRLEMLIESAIKDNLETCKKQLLELKEIHQLLLNELQLDTELLTDNFYQLERIVVGINLLGEVSDRKRALIMSQGELLSTKIGHLYLQRELNSDVLWLDARKHLLSQSHENNYLATDCDYSPEAELSSQFDKYEVILTQGFIASNNEHDTVLLGRGGSDTSAAYFAAKLSAESLEIWTDVEGIFSANPSQVANARVLKQLDYDEAQEMASAGAKVLHPRAIQPAKEYQIPVYIRSTINPSVTGTKIHNTETTKGIVKAITAKEGVTLVSMQSQGMWQQAGYLADLFAIFKHHGISIDLVSTSETNVTVTLDNLVKASYAKALETLVSDLSKICEVEIIENCSAVSIVGQNVRSILHKITPALNIFENYPVYLLSQSASDLNLTFVIDSQYCDKVIASLHESLISNNPNSKILGPTIAELTNISKTEDDLWWKGRQEKIIDISYKHECAYIYSLDRVKAKANQIQAIQSVEKTFFAIKANNNLKVLSALHQEGIGFEVVSIAELELVLREFPEIDRNSIFFTPNFASQSEYKTALGFGINVSLDSSYPLLQWPHIFENQSIFIRVDPNVGKGHHEHVKTAGATSKFGVLMDELAGLNSVLAQFNINVVGLHAHAGSGILTPEHWAEHARLLAGLAEQFPSVKYLNLGGGFGIKERPEQSSLNLKAVDKALAAVKKEYPEFEFWIEPGRFLVADAGVLMAKVTQVKKKQNYYYVGINTGMNSLMRPALYGSYHPVENLSKLKEEKNKLATIVGPICESTDKLAIEIPCPETEEGDLILIDNAGAYGHVMSNFYNMRKPAIEVVI